ncbi:CoA-binding protein [Candidatus Solincola tengchongensis]|uniref:acetate--CoA ligase family protein n=1 Tax=Candidatus Solincola tengchongensis TaxID=2900693 RepID=UPI00257DF418
MHPLEMIMNPRSIAFYGASNNPLKMGSMQLANLLEGGFDGEVYPVHPTEGTVMGLPAYRSISEIGRPVDLAQLVLPTHLVPRIMEECGKAGVRRVIVISGGFKEVQDGNGRERERALQEIASRYGMRFLGPNCVGVMNRMRSLNTTTIPEPPFGGGIALASQSGAYTSMLNPYLRAQGMSICQTISVGNEADLDLVDCLEFFREQDEVRAVGLYVETVRRPERFIAVARETARRKPVVAVYVGGTEAGSRSSLSHTGAVTGPDELYDGLFRQAGVIRAEDIDHMLDLLWALSTQPLPPGPRIAVITNSGGPGTSLAYHLEKSGMRVPEFSPSLQKALRERTGPLTSVANPVDITFETNIAIYKEIAEEAFRYGEVDGAVIYGIFGAADMGTNLKKRLPELAPMEDAWDEQFLSFLPQLAQVPLEHRKPLLVMSFLGTASRTIRCLVENDLPVFTSASRCARALRGLLDYREIRDWLERVS